MFWVSVMVCPCGLAAKAAAGTRAIPAASTATLMIRLVNLTNLSPLLVVGAAAPLGGDAVDVAALPERRAIVPAVPPGVGQPRPVAPRGRCPRAGRCLHRT